MGARRPCGHVSENGIDRFFNGVVNVAIIVNGHRWVSRCEMSILRCDEWAKKQITDGKSLDDDLRFDTSSMDAYPTMKSITTAENFHAFLLKSELRFYTLPDVDSEQKDMLYDVLVELIGKLYSSGIGSVDDIQAMLGHSYSILLDDNIFTSAAYACFKKDPTQLPKSYTDTTTPEYIKYTHRQKLHELFWDNAVSFAKLSQVQYIATLHARIVLFKTIQHPFDIWLNEIIDPIADGAIETIADTYAVRVYIYSVVDGTACQCVEYGSNYPLRRNGGLPKWDADMQTRDLMRPHIARGLSLYQTNDATPWGFIAPCTLNASDAIAKLVNESRETGDGLATIPYAIYENIQQIVRDRLLSPPSSPPSPPPVNPVVVAPPTVLTWESLNISTTETLYFNEHDIVEPMAVLLDDQWSICVGGALYGIRDNASGKMWVQFMTGPCGECMIAESDGSGFLHDTTSVLLCEEACKRGDMHGCEFLGLWWYFNEQAGAVEFVTACPDMLKKTRYKQIEGKIRLVCIASGKKYGFYTYTANKLNSITDTQINNIYQHTYSYPPLHISVPGGQFYQLQLYNEEYPYNGTTWIDLVSGLDHYIRRLMSNVPNVTLVNANKCTDTDIVEDGWKYVYTVQLDKRADSFALYIALDVGNSSLETPHYMIACGDSTYTFLTVAATTFKQLNTRFTNWLKRHFAAKGAIKWQHTDIFTEYMTCLLHTLHEHLASKHFKFQYKFDTTTTQLSVSTGLRSINIQWPTYLPGVFESGLFDDVVYIYTFKLKSTDGVRDHKVSVFADTLVQACLKEYAMQMMLAPISVNNINIVVRPLKAALAAYGDYSLVAMQRTVNETDMCIGVVTCLGMSTVYIFGLSVDEITLDGKKKYAIDDEMDMDEIAEHISSSYGDLGDYPPCLISIQNALNALDNNITAMIESVLHPLSGRVWAIVLVHSTNTDYRYIYYMNDSKFDCALLDASDCVVDVDDTNKLGIFINAIKDRCIHL